MLPDSRGERRPSEKPGKFADTAVPTLIEMVRQGAVRSRLKAKFAGGLSDVRAPRRKPTSRWARNAKETADL